MRVAGSWGAFLSCLAVALRLSPSHSHSLCLVFYSYAPPPLPRIRVRSRSRRVCIYPPAARRLWQLGPAAAVGGLCGASDDGDSCRVRGFGVSRKRHGQALEQSKKGCHKVDFDNNKRTEQTEFIPGADNEFDMLIAKVRAAVDKVAPPPVPSFLNTQHHTYSCCPCFQSRTRLFSQHTYSTSEALLTVPSSCRDELQESRLSVFTSSTSR